MSFCSDVKNELINIRPSACCKPSYIYGFMLFGRSFSIKRIALQTGNANVAKEYADIIKHNYKAQVDITVGGTVRPTYKAEVKSESDRLKILAMIDFGISETVIDRSLFLRDCCIPSFIRGAFLACGNINDPEKEYRAEFSVKTCLVCVKRAGYYIKTKLIRKVTVYVRHNLLYNGALLARLVCGACVKL